MEHFTRRLKERLSLGRSPKEETHLAFRPLMVASPSEKTLPQQENYIRDSKLKAQQCVDEGVAAGAKAAVVAFAASSVPTLYLCRTVPWAKANLNYTAQALIISAATIATYFIVTEKTIMECTRSTSIAAIEKKRSGA